MCHQKRYANEKVKKNKDGATKDELALEPTSELSSDERGDAEVLEAEVVYLIYDYKNYEDEGKFDIPSAKKRRFGIVRVEKGGDFNEALEKSEIHQFKVTEDK